MKQHTTATYIHARRETPQPSTRNYQLVREGRIDATLYLPEVQPGDLWSLGEHRLVCGDSTDPATVARVMGGVQADLMVTDPPYGVAYLGRSRVRKAIANDTLQRDHLRQFIASALTTAPLREGGAFYVFAPTGTNETLFRLALEDAGLQLRQTIVWVKSHFVLSRQDYHNKHETILYGWKAGAAHYFVADRTQHTVWEYKKPNRSPLHPTMKPVEMLMRALTNSSLPGALVFDGFAGSGSTLIACERTGRICRSIELDPHYCAVTIARWEAETSKRAERVESGMASHDHFAVENSAL